MTSYTVKNVNNVCQAFRIENNGTQTMICSEGDTITVNGKTYTVRKRSTDNKCCIYQVFGQAGGQATPDKLIAEENQIVGGQQ